MSLFTDAALAMEACVPAYPQKSPEELRETAASLGCLWVEPRPNEVFLDIDGQEAGNLFIEQVRTRIEWLQTVWPFHKISYKIMKTRSGDPYSYHMVVTFPEDFAISPLERLLIQAALGSDFKRELLGWRNSRVCTNNLGIVTGLYRPLVKEKE